MIERHRVLRVNRLVFKASRYLEADPEVSLILSRKAAEAICKAVYRECVSENVRSILLDKLIEQLGTGDHIPRKILNPLRTIQNYGNFSAHDQEDDDEISSDYARPCLQCLDLVYKWFISTYAPDFVQLSESTQDKLTESIVLVPGMTVSQVATSLGLQPFQIIKSLMDLGIFANINQALEYSVLEQLAKKTGLPTFILQDNKK